ELSEEEITAYEEQADKDLRRTGYRIHSTINKDIFIAQQKAVKNFEHFGPDHSVTFTDEETGETYEVMEPVQTAAVLRENATGKIIHCVGGKENEEKKQLNYANAAERSP